jgi:hypothetical protein
VPIRFDGRVVVVEFDGGHERNRFPQIVERAFES